MSLKYTLHKGVNGGWSWGRGGQRFLAMEDREGNTAWPSQRTYLRESSLETSAELKQQLATLTKETKRSVHRISQESKKRTRKSSKVETCTGEFHKVLFCESH